MVFSQSACHSNLFAGALCQSSRWFSRPISPTRNSQGCIPSSSQFLRFPQVSGQVKRQVKPNRPTYDLSLVQCASQNPCAFKCFRWFWIIWLTSVVVNCAFFHKGWALKSQSRQFNDEPPALRCVESAIRPEFARRITWRCGGHFMNKVRCCRLIFEKRPFVLNVHTPPIWWQKPHCKFCSAQPGPIFQNRWT